MASVEVGKASLLNRKRKAAKADEGVAVKKSFKKKNGKKNVCVEQRPGTRFNETADLTHSRGGNSVSPESHLFNDGVLIKSHHGVPKVKIEEGVTDGTFAIVPRKRKKKKKNKKTEKYDRSDCVERDKIAPNSLPPKPLASRDLNTFQENAASPENTASNVVEDVARKKKKKKRKKEGKKLRMKESPNSGREDDDTLESLVFQRSRENGGNESQNCDNDSELNGSDDRRSDDVERSDGHSELNNSTRLEEDQLFLDHWHAAKGKPDTKFKAYLANARLMLSKYPQTQEIVRLKVDPDVLKDMRNIDLDYPINTAVWAKHNRGRVSSLINRLNLDHRRGQFLTQPEAEEAADFFLQYRESVDGHPFQLSTTCKTKYRFTTQPNVRKAFAVKGISLRYNRFSHREDKILTQNFEVFLAHHHISSIDKEKIHEILFSPDETDFRQSSGLLIFLGHRLLRTSDQVYIAVRRLYHRYAHKGNYNAEETQKMIDHYDDLKRRNFEVTRGHGGDHKVAEEVILRTRRSIYGKYQKIKKGDRGEQDFKRVDLKLLADVIREVMGVTELSKLRRPVLWDRVAAEAKERESMSAFHGLAVADFERLWVSDWRRRCCIYENPRWTWNDCEKLVNEVGRQQTMDKCVDEQELDWEEILKLFPQALDVKHVRSRWLKLRNRTNFYMLKDLCGIVKFLKSDVLPKKLGNTEGVEDVPDDADDSSDDED